MLKTKIKELQQKLELTDDCLSAHYEAQYALSNTDSETKLNKIPKPIRDKISRFYQTMRKYGIYPIKPNLQGIIQWQYLSTYQEGIKQLSNQREKEILLKEKPIQPEKMKEILKDFIITLNT